MQLTSLFTQDEAVSPVIGVILMVAITVILAAVIGTFVLGLGSGISSTAPSASFDFEYQSGSSPSCSLGGSTTLDISHSSGESIPAAQLTVSDGSSSVNWYDCSSVGQQSDVSAGSTASVEVGSSDTIRVLWKSEGDSATLSIWKGPDA